MPDTKPLLCPVWIHFAKPEEKAILAAEFRGEDRARRQIARVFAALAAVAIFIAWIVGR